MSVFIAWLAAAVLFGTVVMLAAMGESITEKAGHLNLGVPGMMYFGAIIGFMTEYYFEKAGHSSALYAVFVPLLSGFAASALLGLLYAFLTVSLRANQNVTGLTITTIGVGLGQFLSVKYLGSQDAKAEFAGNLYNKGISFGGRIGEFFSSLGFMVYVAIILAVLLHVFLNKTRFGLNLRAVGENPATADAAGINVKRYKYLAICVGAGLSGFAGVTYVLAQGMGTWSTNNNIESWGWLAVALVIFATWKPLNLIWGSYVFGFLFWLYMYIPSIFQWRLATGMSQLVQMIPYVVTILVLIISSLRRKKESQPPAGLGVPYFREER
jgi:simple sugar transport system permease protein